MADRKVLLGIGIGIIIGTIFMGFSKLNYELSDAQVEVKARALGMKYPDEVKIMIKDEVKK
ncbi:MAG TPA: hypothetical protein DCL31_19165 [Clostridium sp.]|nr:hypothetical protein [Clostridium argentinense]NFP51384.1 hypothetical protein [Clostridium argentinense]NFP73422.1 hypothetical protein [Clostridium argentinense]NFP78569.1 hypothetical protein [Clostridium argentinense]HAG45051.1 hypothetical protein [Clostridium sp.]